MPRWQGRSKGNPLGYRIFVFIIKTLGVLPAYFVLRFVAFYYFLFSWSSSRHILHYFRRRHGYSTFKSWVHLYRNYYVFGQTLLDKVVVMAGIGNRFTYDFDGEQNLRDMVKGGKGGILISAHVGNWEAAGHLLRRLETRVNVVMYDGEHQRIKDYLESVTGGRNLRIIVIKEDMSHVYAMGEALQNNELICLHADRFLEGNKTARMPLLGEDAPFPVGPFLLSASFRVPVSIVFAFKETATHYHFYGSSPFTRGDDETKAEFMQRLLSAFVEQLEQKVKAYPDQWFNYFNFWGK
ncbi:LpxL/LpxP family acyltransferase [Chryseolinea lacunae]|uniref:Lipid A biosynthesis acyltransferase n=1 Tax=Chryseolinea lacunae TaxID=2801331 RepID=A0ABS1KPK8_9BACT|nr:lipid A biosynthesis acyltransferase [Chryseolinea lacunae]MBL0741275.1 lipid A biosynthesis acyltransferase [Chryseolinea lacunae]